MASIKKRNDKYCVLYYFIDESGNKKKKWETCQSYKEAIKRKAQVEHELLENTFTVPNGQTVQEFLQDFVSLYGEQHWTMATYDSYLSMMGNYINPIIGDLRIQDITAKTIDAYSQRLKKTKAVAVKRKPKHEFVTAITIERIHSLLKCAFHQAVRWGMIARNPYDQVSFKKTRYRARDIWTADILEQALDACKNAKLYVAINLAFACSMREGEIAGLTWDNVHISDADIADDNAHVYIDKELQRCSKKALETLSPKDVYQVFPTRMRDTKTVLVLKSPKTESSIRKVWLPKTVAYILADWKQAQEKQQDFLGGEYCDHNLVVAQADGRPYEGRMILKDFQDLRAAAGLPNVVFHSLRHTSTTYKLKLNNGDLKAHRAIQGMRSWI